MSKECCNIQAVIQEFYDYLKHYILKKVQDPVIAEDLVQEVMLQLVLAHQKSTQVQHLKAWLFQLTRNTIYDYFKKHQISYREDELFTEEVDEDTEVLTVADYIVPMLSLLPEKYAPPLRLSDIDGLPQKAVAQQLKLGLSATKMRIQRGRQQLKELFVSCCNLHYDAQGNMVSCTIKEHCQPLHDIQQALQKHSF